MIRRLAALLLLITNTILVFGQGTLTGTVSDYKTNEPLVGVTVKVNDTTGTVTDISGKFTVQVPSGKYKVQFSFLGYQMENRKGNINNGETAKLSIAMQDTTQALGPVVVTGSKYERKLTEENVSVEVLKSDLIKNTNSVNLSEAVDKVSGVEIFDNQVVIRGGSGYSFGAGSRVLFLLDDMPMLSIDRGEIKMNVAPLEIADQVEVLKSAGSALYGASALNGIINVRTGFAKEKPETEISLYYNTYAQPKDKTASWWKVDNDPRPYRLGGYIVHRRRIGQFDIVASANINKSVGYIRLLDTDYYRLTFKLRYRSKKIPGLSTGIGLNMMNSHEGDYFFWLNSTDGVYVPFGSTSDVDIGSLSMQRRNTVLIDPWVNYFDKHNGKHVLRGRINNVDLKFSTDHPNSQFYFGEYQYQRKFAFGLNVLAGASGQYYVLHDDNLGNHDGHVVSLYTQVDYTIGPLNLFAGFRFEDLKLDTTYHNQKPVGSAGLTIRAGKSTFFRASFGQGYRFPSIAERFVDDGVSGINIYPNPDLKPEYGFNSEVGVKQVIKAGRFLLYADLSFFWMEYWDMTEFEFGIYPPDPIPDGHNASEYLGFKSENVDRARIAGYELSVYSTGNIGKVKLNWQGGYTYNYGVDLNNDPTLYNTTKFFEKFIKSIGSDGPDVIDPLLKYRSRHLVKNDIELEYHGVSLGVDTRFYSNVEKVDAIFTAVIPGLMEYRQIHNKGAFLLNLRLGYEFSKYGKVSFIVNNALNQQISIRPARMEAPLNFTVQYRITI